MELRCWKYSYKAPGLTGVLNPGHSRILQQTRALVRSSLTPSKRFKRAYLHLTPPTHTHNCTFWGCSTKTLSMSKAAI